MAKSSEKRITAERDLERVATLAKRGQLGSALSKLDPDDVIGSIKRVPTEVTRLLVMIDRLSEAPSQIENLSAKHRRSLNQLIKAADEHNAGAFVSALLRHAQTNENVERLLGVRVTESSFKKIEKQIDNTINSLTTRPQLMLQSRRLYSRIAFTQNDVALFNTNLELDALIALSRALLGAASEALEQVQLNAKGVKPAIDTERCTKELKALQKTAREVTKWISQFHSGKRPRAQTKKRPKKKRR